MQNTVRKYKRGESTGRSTSMGGTNYQLSQWAAEGAKEAGAEVKVLKVPKLAPSSHRRKSSLESPC
jgi:multimeric flavodoxin WrbA